METKNYAVMGAGVAVATIVGVAFATLQGRAPEPQPPAATAISPTVSPSSPAGPPAASPNKPQSKPPASPAASPEPASPVASPEPSDSPQQSPAARQMKDCLITMARVADSNPPTNVRSEPDIASKIVTQLENGTFVTVVGEQSGWLQIKEPIKGWLARDRTETSCNQKTERIRFTPGTDRTLVADRFVGAGTHHYLLRANQGQTLTLNAEEGPLPMLLDPSGNPLMKNINPDSQTSWSGTLPANGDYTVQLDSNYKGYDYKFSVQIQ